MPIPQVAAVPYRRRNGALQFCLITSLKRGHWIVPKGIVDPGETEHEAALKEALEEAGLRGRIVGEPLGAYDDFKWGRPLEVTVFLMEVTRSEGEWLEDDARERRWVGPDEAAALVFKPVFRECIKKACQRLADD